MSDLAKYILVENGIAIDVEFNVCFLFEKIQEKQEIVDELNSWVKEYHELKKELEVYKKAMCMASETISALCPPIALGMGAGMFTPKDTEWFLEQAKKELGYE